MTYIADQVKGGIDPLQNHSRNSVEVLETRQVRYACRVVDIDPASGASIVDPTTFGDVVCATNWQPTSRAIGGWAHAWPVIGGSEVRGGGESSTSADAGKFMRAAGAGGVGGVLAAGGTAKQGGAGASKGKGVKADYIILDPSKTFGFGHFVTGIGPNRQSRIVLNPATSFAIPFRYPVAKIRVLGGGAGGGAAGVGGAAGAAGPGGSFGESGPRGGRVITGEGVPDASTGVFQPVQDSAGRPDGGFGQQTLPLPPGYPSIVPNSYGTWLGGTEHRGEEPFYLHGDPRLVSVNNGPDHRAGSTVFDTSPTDGSYDFERWARFQSAWRVMPQPTSNTLPTGKGGTLALQLARSERDGAWGFGSMIDISSPTARPVVPTITPSSAPTSPSSQPSAPAGHAITSSWNGNANTLGAAAKNAAMQAAFQAYSATKPAAVGGVSPAFPTKDEAAPVKTVGLFSARVGGPLEVGHGKKDKHRVGDMGDAGVNVGHLATHAPFFADPLRDGPVAFERDMFPLDDLQHFPLKAPVHLQFDAVESPTKYAMQRTMGKGAPPGVWRMWAEVPHVKEGGYPPAPPPTTGPPDDPPWNRPIPPPPPPPTTVTEQPKRPRPQGKRTPLVGFSGAAPGGWAADGTGPQPGSYGGSGASMGVVDRQPSSNRKPTPGVVDLPTGTPLDAARPASTATTIVQRRTLGFRPDEVTSHALAVGMTAGLWRASETRAGRPDVLTSGAFPSDVVSGELARRPFVLRQEAWGALGQQGFTVAQRPGASRYANGTGAGGVVLLPPEWDLKDVETGASPFAGSTAYFAAYPGVWFGCGTPVLTSGDLKTGARWGFDGTSFVLQGLSSASAAVTGLRVKTDGTPGLRESGGTILDLAGITDGQFLKRSGSTVVGATAAPPSSVVNTADQTGIGDTFADLTSLGFSLASGKTYRFHYWLYMDADATTTGIDVSVNGPATAFLNYTVVFWTSLTARAERGADSYDYDTALTASSGTQARMYEVYGTVKTSAAGTLIARAKREAMGAGPNCRAGSNGLLWALD